MGRSASSFVWPWTRRSGGAETEGERRWRIFWSYIPDWVLTIFLWAIFYLLDKVQGYRRLFSVTDTSLAYPYAEHERVPVWLLAVTCGIVPAVIIILYAAIIQRSFWDAHSGVLGLVLSLGLTATFTDIVKITAGRPRPDLFARCQLPSTLTSNPTHSLTSWTACTDTSLLNDGFRSFFSGHSSFAWCGMWFLVLYLAAKMRINNRQGYTYKSWLLLAPISCATLISISRTMDYRHHATDVIAGAVVGILGAWYSYRQYYPPLSAPQSYKPYSPRIARPGSIKSEDLPLHANPAPAHGHGGRYGDSYGGRPSTDPLNRGEFYGDGTPAGTGAGGLGMRPGAGAGMGNGTGVGAGAGAGAATFGRNGPGVTSEQAETVPR
ncbi:hypothetical protein EHS25_000587 [Saitozyma podzolica]|uniref:Phosphatidic acid phosphatase type 2/haloperoxidase domain-containing protein n=1 Tax=Saitozyma podzolica TaxID=1890683 RepID=A0A427YWT4_9TREE|nr:hypothetical protein EHS25_000587 [Saitozyma podzolica]